MLKRLSFGAIVLLTMLSLVACGDTVAPVAQPTASTTATPAALASPIVGAGKAVIGRAAPEFTATGMDGKPVQLSALRGKAVVVNYWMVSCVYCLQEEPDFVKAAQANSAKLAMVGVDMNDDPQDVQQYIKDQKIPYPIIIDNTGDMTYAYLVHGHPTSIFIDRNGIVTGVIEGLASPDMLQQQVDKALTS